MWLIVQQEVSHIMAKKMDKLHTHVKNRMLTNFYKQRSVKRPELTLKLEMKLLLCLACIRPTSPLPSVRVHTLTHIHFKLMRGSCCSVRVKCLFDSNMVILGCWTGLHITRDSKTTSAPIPLTVKSQFANERLKLTLQWNKAHLVPINKLTAIKFPMCFQKSQYQRTGTDRKSSSRYK